MPRVKIDYIVSFSNEDPEHPANNLLSWEVGKKRWLCCPGETSCSVVLQLTRAVKISAIHIGSYHAAMVEVLVGRSEKPNDAFEVLVPSSVFLTPAESRREPVDRVRSFSGDQLANDQRWDRVRVVCRQPYNKQAKYGLSFIQIYEPETGAPATKAPSPVPLPASRAIAASTNYGHSSSDEDDYRPGQLFAATKLSAGSSTNTGSQIRQATSQLLKNITDTAPKIVKSPIVKKPSTSLSQKVSEEPSGSRHRDNLMYTDEEEQPHNKIDSVVQRHQDEKAKEKDAREAKEKLQKEKKEKEKAERQKDDHRKEAKKEEHRGSDNNAKRVDKDKREDHNTSRSDRNNDDVPRRDQKTHSQTNKDESRTDRDKKDDERRKKNDQRQKNDDRSRDDHDRHRNRHNDSTPRPGRSDDSDSRNRDNTPSKRKGKDHDQERKIAKKRPRPNDSDELRPGPISSSPHTLLSQSSLVLSGYVHPRRGRLRAAAAALGAAVLHDWGPEATHLICAFPNTPKLRQALATNPNTPVATGEWVEKCCELRRLLPWQWFATEPSRRVDMPDLSSLPTGDDGQEQDGDTDDEIERVLREQKKRRRSSTQNIDNANDQKDDSANDVEFVRDERIKGRWTVQDSDSDVDKTIDDLNNDDVSPKALQMDVDSDGNVTDLEPVPASPEPKHDPLPNFFDGYTFYIEADVATAGLDADLLRRYVRAYGGVLVEEWDEDTGPVDYVLCGGTAAARGNCVRADWLWRCHHERRLCSPDRYLLRPADT